MECIYCAVRTEFFNKIPLNVRGLITGTNTYYRAPCNNEWGLSLSKPLVVK